MTTASNLFLCDALDVTTPVELMMYKGAIKVMSLPDYSSVEYMASQKLHLSVLYLFLVTGDEKYLKVASLLGSFQESNFLTISELLSSPGTKFKPNVLKNLVRYISSFYPNVVTTSQNASILIKSMFHYLPFLQDDTNGREILLGSLIHILRLVSDLHLDDMKLRSQVIIVLGRLLVENHRHLKQEFGILHLLLHGSCEEYCRETIRSCLELSGIADFNYFFTSESANRLMSVTSNQSNTLLRIPPSLWTSVTFILDNISQSSAPLYLKMLCLDEYSEEFLVDLIRAIIICYHPPNKILGSGNIQRWEFILAILKGFKNPSTVASSKLAIYFDWLLVTPNLKRNIMLFEPGCLLITRSNSDMVKLSLLEFLFLCSREFNPLKTAPKSINNVFSMLVELGVMKWKEISVSKSSQPLLVEFVSELQRDRLNACEPNPNATIRPTKGPNDQINTTDFLLQIMRDLEQRKAGFLLKHGQLTTHEDTRTTHGEH